MEFIFDNLISPSPVMKISAILFLSLSLIFNHETVLAQTGDNASRFPEIRIYIPKSHYNNLLQSKGQKVELRKPVFIINGDTAVVKEAHSRGNNSLTFERKSLSVDLENSFTIGKGEKKIKIRKFDLLNLVMDKNLWHNRWAFLNMARLDIFPLINVFCTLWINDQPQGIYLLVEKPHYYSSGKGKSPYMIRRGLDHKISDEYIDTPSKEESKKYKNQYINLYEDLEKYKGVELYGHLKTKINLDHYFDWLAFNYLIMNGDYEDELYVYIVPGSGLFDVIPWDYDDILRAAPHEGLQARNAVSGFKNKLIFSSEDLLDRAIAADDFVYAQYLSRFKKLLTDLSVESFSKISDQVRDELQSVAQNQKAANASLFLGKEPFQIEQAIIEIQNSLNFIIQRRNALLTDMK